MGTTTAAIIDAHRRMIRLATGALAAIALVASGCSGDDPAPGATSSATTGDAVTTPSGDDTVDPETAAGEPTPAVTTGQGATPGPAASPTGPDAQAQDLPGEAIDLFVQDGDVLAVIGVAHNDVLNVRSIPGTVGDIVATASPTADDLVATGRARSLPSSIWFEVAHDDTTGWVRSSFVAYLGGTDDATAGYLAMDRRRVARSIGRLGRVVARGYASTEPRSRIVRVVAATRGDLHEVTFDVVGLGDDSVRGLRLHVFGEPRASGNGVGLRTIERTLLCDRGTSGELCS